MACSRVSTGVVQVPLPEYVPPMSTDVVVGEPGDGPSRVAGHRHRDDLKAAGQSLPAGARFRAVRDRRTAAVPTTPLCDHTPLTCQVDIPPRGELLHSLAASACGAWR